MQFFRSISTVEPVAPQFRFRSIPGTSAWDLSAAPARARETLNKSY